MSNRPTVPPPPAPDKKARQQPTKANVAPVSDTELRYQAMQDRWNKHVEEEKEKRNGK